MHILDRYILRNHIPPYFFGLSVITFVFIMDFIFRYLDLFIGKGVELLVVLEFFVLSLGHMFALIIPMSVMPATLMAFGQLASDNEITAMKASGISLYRMILPVLIAAALLAVGLIYYNNVILPESNHKLMNLMIDIGKMKPTLKFKENIFSSELPGYTILIQEKNDKTGEIKKVQIFEKKKTGVPTTIIAEKGKMFFIEEDNVWRFELENGEIHEIPEAQDVSTYLKTLFKHYTVNIRDEDRSLERSERSHRGDREMNVAMMQAQIRDRQDEIARRLRDMNRGAAAEMKKRVARVMPEFASPDSSPEPAAENPDPALRSRSRDRRVNPAEKALGSLESQYRMVEGSRNQISRYQVEIHKKFSIPFSCIIFILLGAPLAIRSGKKGMTMSIGFSILFFLVYYMFLISGEKLADRRLLVAWLAMWLPNIVLSTAAVLLLFSTVRESQTINWDRVNLAKRWRHGR
ncbi:MAG: LptF/LptG family permease [Candidatus Krumholzibacteriota bacterium]|nr:LptF/LptG family permease [Candidatus Krumholzibacteriota bacterium]